MRPSISILQLDTQFPRVPGDVACPATYLDVPEILTVRSATVRKIVNNQPAQIDIRPFEEALDQAKGDIIATSCGFLSYWQYPMAARTTRPFVSSALIALDHLSQRFDPDELMILTFDQAQLTADHLGAHPTFARSIIGLPHRHHLRGVIETDALKIDQHRAAQELAELVEAHWTPRHKHLLLECTNLPPYKAALRQHHDREITDILTVIEAQRPNTVRPEYL
ncbi:hypothetical protein [Algirhabdus cladophorae]|uniref:hypothetical protein n=1 Tax=Algirhabdus cladophorae TaxID=3377108 RepID=UPI003B846A31